jgi:hypothetical protein
LIFNIYIDDLLDKLTYEFGKKAVFAYADDIMIITRSKLRCEKAMEIIFRWCITNKMELNKKKSGIL